MPDTVISDAASLATKNGQSGESELDRQDVRHIVIGCLVPVLVQTKNRSIGMTAVSTRDHQRKLFILPQQHGDYRNIIGLWQRFEKKGRDKMQQLKCLSDICFVTGMLKRERRRNDLCKY